MGSKFLKFFVDDNEELKMQILESNKYILDFETIKKQVGDYYDIVRYVDFGKKNIDCYVDDAGLLKQLKPTFWVITGKKGEPFPLVGPVIVVKHEDIYGDGLDAVGLTDEEIQLVQRHIYCDGYGHYFLLLDKETMDARKEFIENLKKLVPDFKEFNMN